MASSANKTCAMKHQEEDGSRQKKSCLSALSRHLRTHDCIHCLDSSNTKTMIRVASALKQIAADGAVMPKRIVFLNGLSVEAATALRESLLAGRAATSNDQRQLGIEIVNNDCQDSLFALFKSENAGAQGLNLSEIVLKRAALYQAATAYALVQRALLPSQFLQTLVLEDVSGLYSQSILLAPSLSTRSSLTKVRFIRCAINCVGATALAEALKDNKKLTYLDLQGNPIGEQGVTALMNALCHNTSLQILALVPSESYACKTIVLPFSKMLRANNTLQHLRGTVLDVGYQPSTTDEDTLTDAMMQNMSLLSMTSLLFWAQPTLLNQKLTASCRVNNARAKWNTSLSFRSIRRHHSQHQQQAKNENDDSPQYDLLSYYLAKLATKPAVLYLALHENASLLLPIMGSRVDGS